MRKIAAILLVAMICMLTGCMDMTQTLNIKKDGSGTLVQEMYMSPALLGMMQGAASMAGNEAGAAAAGGVPIEIDKYKAAVPEMGEGVKFVSADEVSKPDGSKGVKVVFSFNDINKLKMPENMEGPDMGDTPSKPDEKDDSDPITFSFKARPVPQLVIILPQPEDNGDATEAPEAPEPSPEQMMQMQMMKGMLQGMRMRMLVKVDGKITKTNASHTGPSKEGGPKDTITLADIDVGKLLENQEGMKKMMGMGRGANMNDARKALADMPGVKIETARKIAVVFR